MDRSEDDKPPKPLLRGWLVPALIAVACMILGIELLSVLVYPLTAEQPYSRSRIQNSLAEQHATAPDPDLGGAAGQQGFMPDQILHPYAGFAYNPRKLSDVNEFGFFGASPLVKRSAERVNLAILGGSVARELYEFAGSRLAELLAESPRYRDREIHIFCLAVDGYKQPQPLLIYTFATYLGAEFDIVINLDGFNEIVLPLTDNLPSNVFSHYPRNWNFYSDKGQNLDHAVTIAELVSLEESRQALSDTFSAPLLFASNFMLILWESLDHREEFQAQQAYLALVDASRSRNRAASYGPVVDYGDDSDSYFRDAAGRWAQASIQIRDITVASGARYFHFLQPNQYVEGSKVFTEAEARIADVDAFTGQAFPYHPSLRLYKQAAEQGYPHLFEAAGTLRASGVQYADLTMIFADVREQIYRDACCHYNPLGNELLAERIAREITRDDG